MENEKIFLEIIDRALYSIGYELGQLTKLPDRIGAGVKRRKLLKLRNEIKEYAGQVRP